MRILAIIVSALATTVPAFADVPKAPTGEPPAVEAHIRALDKEWALAEDKRDGAALDRLLDEHFVFVGSGGGIMDRAGYIAEVLSDGGVQSQLVTSDVVHINRDTAVSVGTTTVATKGEPQSTSYRYTVVYVLRAGEWKAVSCQLAALKPKGAEP